MNHVGMNLTEVQEGAEAYVQPAGMQKLFTLLRTQLLLELLPKGLRLIGISSPSAGEGRTFVSINLAEAIAHAHPCVVVDLNFETPDLTNSFALAGSPGVLDFLAKQHPLHDLLYLTNRSQLQVLPVGKGSAETAAAMLFSERLEDLYTELKSLKGDPLIIFDLPPALDNEAFLVLAKRLEGQIMIVAEDLTSAHDLEDALRLSADIPLIGTILNMTEDLIS